MAKQTQVIIYDDLTGEGGAETDSFMLDGHHYEIDLSEENRRKLREYLAPFIAKARPVRIVSKPRKGPGSRGGRQMTRERSAEIRNWAKANNHPVSERGRIAANVVEAYEESRYAPAARRPEPKPDPMAAWRLIEPYTAEDEKRMMADWWASTHEGKRPHSKQWTIGMAEFRRMLAD